MTVGWMNGNRLLAAAAAAAALAGCGDRAEPDASAEAARDGYEADPVATAPPGNSQVAPGEWQRQDEAGEPVLLYRQPSGDPMLAFRCDSRGGLVIDRLGVVSTPPVTLLRLGAGSEISTYAVRPLQSNDVLRATIPGPDAMLSQLRRPVPLMLDFGSGPPIRLPATALLPRLVVDCERAQAAPSGGA